MNSMSILKSYVRGKVHGNITRSLYKAGKPKEAKATSTLWKISRVVRIFT